MTAAAPRWTRLEPDQRRQEILSAARDLFGRRGYSAVSTEDIARRAGVRRGLLHHYFGTKRDLFIEVMRGYVDAVSLPLETVAAGLSIDDVVARSVDRWLDFVERETAAWFGAMGADGVRHDPDVDRLVEQARDATVEAIIAVVGIAKPAESLRSVLRAYAGLAEAATREWLQAGRITRAQTHALLSTSLLAMVRDVAPAVEATGP